MRLAWPPPWHLIASVLVSIIALALVHLSPSSLQGTLSFPALILVLLIPGYLAVLYAFPGKSDITLQRRALLSLVFSVLLAGLFSLILTATPRGLNSASLATILSLLAIFLAAVAYGRWSNLLRNRRFLLLPKKGRRSVRAFPGISGASIKSRRAALAIVLLAVCFIAALAFVFAPYHILSGETSTEHKVTWPGEALSYQTLSSQLLGSLSLPYKEERQGVNLSQNKSRQPSSQFRAESSTSINSTGLNATENNSLEIPEDESQASIFSAGGGGMGGSSSSGSTQTVAKQPASQTTKQPQKTARSLPTDIGIAAGKVQSNTSVAGKNVSNLSIPTSKENQTGKDNQTLSDNLTFDQVDKEEVKIAAKPAPLSSSTAIANETQASLARSLASSPQALSSDKLSSEPSSISEVSPFPEASLPSTESSSSLAPDNYTNESNLSRAATQSEIETRIDKSQEQGTINSDQPPALKALVPDRASPQQQGAAIFWRAEATDEEGDKILYKFLLDGQEARKWSKINSWSWLTTDLPAGDYRISVLARDGKHAPEDSFDSSMDAVFTLSRPNQVPALQELKSNRASPQGRGSKITWTASATDPDSDQIYYKFMKDGKEVTDWFTSNSWVWDTSSENPGDYKIAVQAKDGLHASKDSFDSSMDRTFTLTSPNSIPQVTELKADRSSPQARGSVITWAAVAVDPEADEISYKFLANDREVRGWSSSNSWVWDTSSALPGEYRIKALARDGKHASEDSFDSFQDAVITINVADSNQPPALLALVPDIASPRVQGATIIWTAEALDPEGDKILYKFQLNGRDMGRWSESASWKWSSRDLAAGDYKIRVLARDGKHASEDSFDSSMDAVFSLISEIDLQIDRLMEKRSVDASKEAGYQSSDIQVASGSGTKSSAVLGKSNSTARQENTVTPRKLGA